MSRVARIRAEGFDVENGYVGRPLTVDTLIVEGPKATLGRQVHLELDEADALRLAAELIAGVERRRRVARIRAEGMHEPYGAALRHREASELLELAEEALLERDRRAGVTS